MSGWFLSNVVWVLSVFPSVTSEWLMLRVFSSDFALLPELPGAPSSFDCSLAELLGPFAPPLYAQWLSCWFLLTSLGSCIPPPLFKSLLSCLAGSFYLLLPLSIFFFL